jgi:hypothetical protein
MVIVRPKAMLERNQRVGQGGFEDLGHVVS